MQSLFKSGLSAALLATLTACSDGSFSGSSKKADTADSDRSSAEARAADNNKDPTKAAGEGGSSASATGTTPKDAAKDAGSGNSNGSGGTVADDGEFKCDKGQKGLAGKVYQLPVLTLSLPNFATLAPVGQIDADNLDVAPRKWTDGFPGVSGLIEWFGVQFFAALAVPADGAYQFQTNSDDGSKVYIDDQLVLTNDGIHGPTVKQSEAVTLKKGSHKLKVEWYQGPGDTLALQLYWQKPGGSFEIIPKDALQHGKDCDLKALGHFP